MLKRLTFMGFIFLLSVVISGCGSDNTGGQSSEPEEKQKQIEKEKLQKKDKEEKEESEEKKENKVTIEKGETIVIDDFCEFTLVDTKFSKIITPPNPDSVYSYYETKEPGTTYLDTVIIIKSLLTSGKPAEEFASVDIIYNEKYEYTTFSAIEENGGSDFTYTSITPVEPLKSGTLHFIAELPEEVVDAREPLGVIVTINNEKYHYRIR